MANPTLVIDKLITDFPEDGVGNFITHLFTHEKTTGQPLDLTVVYLEPEGMADAFYASPTAAFFELEGVPPTGIPDIDNVVEGD